MISPFSFCSLLHKVSNWEGALDLNRSRIAQVNLVKSSTTIIMYIFPPRDFVLVGPIRSMCKSSRGLVVAVVNVAGCHALDFFFQSWQGPHTTLSTFVSLGSPKTAFVLNTMTSCLYLA